MNIAKDPTQKDVILQTIASMGDGEHMTVDIYENLPEQYKFRFRDVTAVSKALNLAKNQKAVINGPTNYENGKARLTWRLVNEDAANKFMVSALAETQEAKPVVAKVEAARDVEQPVVADKATTEHETVIDQIIDAAKTVIALSEALSVDDKPDIANLDYKISKLNELAVFLAGSLHGELIESVIKDYEGFR